MEIRKRVAEAVAFLELRLPEKPEIAVLLGSGLAPLADRAERLFSLEYWQIPGFPKSSVPGHPGHLVVSRIEDVPVLFLQGRVHYYEGVPLSEATLPLRVLRGLGVRVLLLTNASGGINPEIEPGEIVAVSDHINLMGTNPLIGYVPSGDEPRFVDLSRAYSERLRAVAREEAAALGFALREGVYAAVSGPSYETPAEIRFLGRVGADLIGMSTVPDVIVAKQEGYEILVLSCVANRAAGIGGAPLLHEEVLETTARAAERFSALVGRIVRRVGKDSGPA